MGPGFDNGPVVHHDDVVRVLDGGQPVGNDEAGPVLQQFAHGVLNLNFGPRIDGTGGFIQDENLGVGDKGSRNGDELPMPL